ncbi:MFS transporter [Psychromicrobium xiongbiense]|uniref:MFS transporter n=1 Tax=Psychromicrobium xiongbiense TaxID=3051184 RepID=UPI002555FE9E|nr:MFS transporter [Psychromicrobium sp. YIM S02556]
MRNQRRNQAALICAQLFSGVGIASGVAVGGLIAEQVAGSTAAAGFGQTASVLGAGLVALPLARLAAARGRRFSLTLGFSLAAAGAVIVLLAVASTQFWLLLIGMMCFGSATATGLQSRYAATELVDPSRQARAMSIVVWATTLGSVAGPNLSEPGSRLGAALGLNALSGPYLFSIVAFICSALVVSTLRIGTMPASAGDAAADEGPSDVPASKPLSALASLRMAAGNRSALFAMIAIVAGQMMMTCVMVMTPVHMNHDGMSLELVGVVLSAHILGMYALSPVFGWLADKLGARIVVMLGAALFVTAFAFGAFDATAEHSQMLRITVALVLLGLGWSACLIGGSTLLTESVRGSARLTLQGSVDALMNLGAAALAALAGPVLAWGGFLAINVLAACVLVPLLVAGVRAFQEPVLAHVPSDHAT